MKKKKSPGLQKVTDNFPESGLLTKMKGRACFSVLFGASPYSSRQKMAETQTTSAIAAGIYGFSTIGSENSKRSGNWKRFMGFVGRWPKTPVSFPFNFFLYIFYFNLRLPSVSTNLSMAGLSHGLQHCSFGCIYFLN